MLKDKLGDGVRLVYSIYTNLYLHGYNVFYCPPGYEKFDTKHIKIGPLITQVVT